MHNHSVTLYCNRVIFISDIISTEEYVLIITEWYVIIYHFILYMCLSQL